MKILNFTGFLQHNEGPENETKIFFVGIRPVAVIYAIENAVPVG